MSSTSLERLWAVGKGAVKDFFEQLGVTRDLIWEDFTALKENGREKIAEMFDEWASNKKIREWFEGFLRQAARGREAAKDYLKNKDLELRDYLDKQVRLTPHLVGGVDGFMQVYLATPANRWARSPRYRKGVRTGRVIGMVCAVTIFLPVSLGRAVIGLLPGASRLARYVVKQWDVAKEKISTSKNDAI